VLIEIGIAEARGRRIWSRTPSKLRNILVDCMEFCWKQFDILAKKSYRDCYIRCGMLARADVPEVANNGKALR
jgi:hypothetical protein